MRRGNDSPDIVRPAVQSHSRALGVVRGRGPRLHEVGESA